MIRPDSDMLVVLCVAPVDMRKHSAGLAAFVQDELELDPFAATIYGFVNKRRTQVRLLTWERNGFVLWTKRLERDRFHWPREAARLAALTTEQLNWLLDGIDLTRVRPHAALHFESVL